MKHIVGHKNPDTDTVCSALGYQKFLELKGEDSKAFALGEVNNETRFVLGHFSVDAPEVIFELPHESEIVLMDHNESGQSIDNVDELDIVEIIDHHKIKLQTDKPIRIHIEPLGSSCSIVAKRFFQEEIEVPKEIAGILLSGIISDTLFFRSPTTTDEDKEIAEKLNAVAGVEDLEGYSMQMFDAKSDISEIDTADLVKMDYKIFEFGGDSYGIGVVETTNKDFALSRKEEILENLASIKEADQLKGVFLSVIDILKKESFTLCSGDKEVGLFTEMFNAEDQDGILYVPNMVSRKKEIVPVFEKTLNK